MEIRTQASAWPKLRSGDPESDTNHATADKSHNFLNVQKNDPAPEKPSGLGHSYRIRGAFQCRIRSRARATGVGLSSSSSFFVERVITEQCEHPFVGHLLMGNLWTVAKKPPELSDAFLIRTLDSPCSTFRWRARLAWLGSTLITLEW